MSQESGITLYTTQTPNGIKISITLEEIGYVQFSSCCHFISSLHFLTVCIVCLFMRLFRGLPVRPCTSITFASSTPPALFHVSCILLLDQEVRGQWMYDEELEAFISLLFGL